MLVASFEGPRGLEELVMMWRRNLPIPFQQAYAYQLT